MVHRRAERNWDPEENNKSKENRVKEILSL
jgi:hypothetical protein